MRNARMLPFHEYYHGDSGAGIGASHQTGWSGLIANLVQDHGLARDKRVADGHGHQTGSAGAR